MGHGPRQGLESEISSNRYPTFAGAASSPFSLLGTTYDDSSTLDPCAGAQQRCTTAPGCNNIGSYVSTTCDIMDGRDTMDGRSSSVVQRAAVGSGSKSTTTVYGSRQCRRRQVVCIKITTANISLLFLDFLSSVSRFSFLAHFDCHVNEN
jgi:hypothetical protein